MNEDILVKVINLTKSAIESNNKLLEVNKRLIDMNIKKSKITSITVVITVIIIALFLLALYCI